MKIDTRLVGATAENVFLSLINERRVFAHSFDAAGFDGIVFDVNNRYFKVGRSPFFVQIKCRGSKGKEFNPQGHPQKTISNINAVANELKIPDKSLYFVVGFFKNNDIRQMTFFIIPFASLHLFEKNRQYRFSVSKCKAVKQRDSTIREI